MIPLARDLVNTVDIHRAYGVLFIYRQVIRASIYLSCSGKDNFYIRVIGAAGLQNGKLRLGIDLKICERISHGVHMACLTSQVKKKILPLNQIAHRVRVAYISDIKKNFTSNAFQIGKIASIFRNKTIHYGNHSTRSYKSPRKICTDKACSASNKNIGT